MTEIIECFYSLSSPWAYFGGPQFEELARRHDARIVLRPYDFLKVVPENGGVPLRTRPQPRQDYHATELDRWRRFLGMPLNLKPRFYPTDNKPAGHMVIAAQRAGRRKGFAAQALSHAILRALWAEEQDIASPDTRRAIADRLGLDGAALVEAEQAPETVEEYEANTRSALERGVFGAPSYYWRGTLYWGQDRLFFLDRDLSEVTGTAALPPFTSAADQR
ncbi:MAG TPA: 2-hydroxychromene-2-carboxylate isomerase [Arenibaculum sp.]|nr:2-hydroxychromene-2-carboxylate isomerase [Arenibaculum sp.]